MNAAEEIIWPQEEGSDEFSSLLHRLISFSPVDERIERVWSSPDLMTLAERLDSRVRGIVLGEQVEGVAITILAASSLSDICAQFCGHSCGKTTQYMIDNEDCGIQEEAFRLKVVLAPHMDSAISNLG